MSRNGAAFASVGRIPSDPGFASAQDFQKAAEEVHGEAHAAEQGLHRYGALLSQLPPTVRTMLYTDTLCVAPAAVVQVAVLSLKQCRTADGQHIDVRSCR